MSWKNSRHFSKKEKQNKSNYPNQKIVFICTGISVNVCTEILSTQKLILQNFVHSIPPQITAVLTHRSTARKLILSDLPTAIWLPALSHLSDEFSHIWLTCYKDLSICLLFLPVADRDRLSRQLEVFSCCSPNWIMAKKD